MCECVARLYHNLQGWMRDVRAALKDGDVLAYELAELIIDIDELVDEAVERAADRESIDHHDSTADERQTVLAGVLPERSSGDAPGAGGPVPRSGVDRTTPHGVGGQLGDLARQVGGAYQPTVEPVRRDAVGAPALKGRLRRGT